MKAVTFKFLQQMLVALVLAIGAQSALADVSGTWVFAVTLGDLGSGNADITLTQEADGKLTGTYAGQLANGPVQGTYSGDNFEFSFNSDLLGGEIIYRGSLKADGTVAGTVVVQAQDIGTFTGRKQ